MKVVSFFHKHWDISLISFPDNLLYPDIDLVKNEKNTFDDSYHVRIQRVRQGSEPPAKNHKNIGFLSISGPDPLKITKLPSQHSMLGHHQHTSETPFRWRFDGGPMMARL